MINNDKKDFVQNTVFHTLLGNIFIIIVHVFYFLFISGFTIVENRDPPP